jgi:hypothetical protein
MESYKPFYNETIDGFDYYMCPTTFIACINDECDYYIEDVESVREYLKGGEK